MGKNYVDVRLSGAVDTSTGGLVLKVKDNSLIDAVDTSTGGTVIQVKDRKHDVHTIYSNRGVRTTISSTRYDTAGRGINSIIFITDGALTSLTCTDMQLSTNISSGTTLTAGSIIYVNNASKVKCSSHGAQLIYFNS